MSQLSESIAQLKADDETLAAEIDQLLVKLQQVPAEIAAAVQSALADAGVSDAAAVDAITAIDAGVRASLAKVAAVLSPPTGDAITDGAQPASDTVTGGTVDDAVQV